MKRKILSLLLSFTLCLTLLPTAAFAADSTDTWDGTADTSWYTSAPDAPEYHISTAEQLAGLAQLINKKDDSVTFKDKTVYLNNDLDMGGHEWISIGNGLRQENAGHVDPEGWYSFCGTFDGQGHVIYNLYSHDSLLDNDECFDANTNIATSHGRDVYKTGLFGSLYKGTIKNLGIKDADIWIDPNDVSTYGEGILVDYIEDATIENCWTTGSITGGSYFEQWIGGIVGSAWGTCTISGCYSSAEIVGNYLGKGYNVPGGADPMFFYDSLGGIVGGIPIYGTLDISDCWFDGKITVKSIQAAVGGIVGFMDGGTVNNCMVTTTDMSVDEGGNTCWVAFAPGGTVTNNYWPNNDKYGAIPREDVAGTPVSDFTSDTIITSLNENAEDGITWVAGIKHPTFAWDVANIPADYTKVDEAIEKANALNENDYRDFSAVKAALNAVIRGKNITEQAEVDAMAQAIEDAINALVRRSSGGSSSPSYPVTTPGKTENGTVTVSPRSAEKGDTVTITVKPDSGYQLDDLTVTDKNGREVKLTDKGNGKYTFTMPASKVEINATFVKKVEPSPFSDVSTSAYYYEAVKWAQEKEITGGIGNGLFGPNRPCTRAQIVTFLWRAAGSPVVNYAMNMTDVAEDAYYAEAVRWALSEGITTGTGDGQFSPDSTCTREQAVAFLYRASGSPAVSDSSAFSDVAASAYYANAVAWAEKNGVTGGIGNGKFGTGSDCTRAQIVTFLYRAYQGK